MFYKSYSVDPEWRKQVKENPFLSDEEKRELIKRAESHAAGKTAKSVFISLVVTLIIMAIFGLF